jgi:hypothetical protein
MCLLAFGLVMAISGALITHHHLLSSSVYPPTEVSGSAEVPGMGFFQTL